MRFGLPERRRQTEIMDQPDLDPARHGQALRGLERINFWSGSAGIVWPGVRQAAAAVAPRRLRVLDLASGAGDIAVRLWRRARRQGLDVEVAGCDRSPTALAHARRLAARRGADVGFFPCDVLAGPLPEGYDVLLSSLFLHHLDDAQAVDLLARMRRATGRLVLINDLVRGPLGLALARVGTHLLSRSDVVQVDGPRSVAGAFTVPEMQDLARRAGLDGARVERRWPCRMLLTWGRA
jgi:2-polyprenyl-3-methyl-5-hydroxy-6-metoxy-1,4-benzoquinol methylase